MNRTSSDEKFRRQFASDNWSGICPEAWDAMARANQGHAAAYGEDAYTRKACDLIREFFETDCQVFFTFNGTAANSLALATLCRSYHSVICHQVAHIETGECGAPQFFSNGTTVLTVKGTNGKVDIDDVERIIKQRDDVHYPKPRVVSLTQPTEVGTVYTPDELAAVRELTRRHGLLIHMDGARFGNAVASLGVAPKEITWEAGVDVLCLGGTKSGLPVGDAVVFFDTDLAHEFDYRCKQAGQLASKMRFLSAPWIGMLETGAYLKYGAHANKCAAMLEERLRETPGITIEFPRETNGVFVRMPQPVADGLHARGWMFHSFIGGAARLMCSWDTTTDDINAFVNDAQEVARQVSANGKPG